MGSKCRDSFISLTLEIKSPSLVRARNGSLASLDRHVILANNRLAVEDKKWGCLIGLPTVQVTFDMCLDAC